MELLGRVVPEGTKKMSVVPQFVPVAWPTVAVKTPPCSRGLEQVNPDREMHVVPRNEELLKTPNENRAARTIAIIKMAQP